MSKLTKTVVENIIPGDADKWAWDSTLPGFGVRVQPSGRRTFLIRYRTHEGQQRKLTVGRCTDLTPDQARDIAKRAFAAVAAGEDPTKKRRDARVAPTMADLAERYMRLHARPYKKPSSVRHDIRNWARVLPELGSRKIESITQEDMLSIHGALSQTPVTANHVRALLSHMFTMAIKWKLRTAANPCIGVPRFKIRQRELVLTPAQLGDMNRALTELVDLGRIRQQHADLFRLLILTGCRLSEIMTARREWVDVERRLLLLPDSKVGQRRVNLPMMAIAIIEAMPEHQWLIPGKIARRHMETPHAAWERVKAHAGLPRETRIHDLRHTAGSLGHRAGLSQRQIADMLGHRNLATTERYLHGFVEDRARSSDTVADAITADWGK